MSNLGIATAQEVERQRLEHARSHEIRESEALVESE